MVEKQLGPLTYQVHIISGQVWKWQIDHLSSIQIGDNSVSVGDGTDGDAYLVPNSPIQPITDPVKTPSVDREQPTKGTPSLQYPQRLRQPPQRFDPSTTH